MRRPGTLNLGQVACFAAIVRHGSFRAAALALGRSQAHPARHFADWLARAAGGAADQPAAPRTTG